MENCSVDGLLIRELPVPVLPSESTVLLSLGTYALSTLVYYSALNFHGGNRIPEWPYDVTEH